MKSFRQLMRTPLRSLLGLLLITASCAMLCLGVGQYEAELEARDGLEKRFTTVAVPTKKVTSRMQRKRKLIPRSRSSATTSSTTKTVVSLSFRVMMPPKKSSDILTRENLMSTISQKACKNCLMAIKQKLRMLVTTRYTKLIPLRMILKYPNK